MISVVVVLLILGCGWRAYRNARRGGTWSNKQFLVTLLAVFGLCAVISFPIILISPKTMQAHEGLAIASILLSIFVGVTVITIYANRWKKRDDLKRSGQNRAIGVAITTFLLLAAGASAQTTYRDPGGSFTMSVPAGWKTQKNPESSQVTISKGDASVSFDIAPTEDGSTPPPKDVLEGVEKQVMQECPQAEVLRHGEAALASQPGLYVQISCNDPQNGVAVMTVAVATTNGKVLIGNMRAYSTEYSSVKPILDRIADSIRLGSSGARADAAAPRVPEKKLKTSASSNQDSRPQGNSDSAGNAQRLKALESACSSGVLTPEECTAKRAALTTGGSSSNPSDNNAQLQALQRACDAGVFTPQECKAKLAALNGADSNGGRGDAQAPGSAQSEGQTGWVSMNGIDRQPTSSGAGNLYRDPVGAFSIMIPQGWTANTNHGCYGPAENCPSNATGVNIKSQGRSWAFVAPFSGNANQPTDVVKSVAEHVRSEYQNFEVLQNDPEKLNGLNIAVGHFAGTDEEGEPVSLVVIGIAAPGGRYFVAESSVPQSESQTVGQALSSMPGTLRFAGQQIETFNDAYRNGLLTREEHDAKLKAMNAPVASPSAEEEGNLPAAPATADFGPMKTVELIDPMFNMVAYTVTIPANWRYEGTVLHGPGCDGNEYAGRAFRASSSDGLFGIQFIPPAVFYWGNAPRAIPEGPYCKNLPPISAAAYGELVSIRMRPGSEVDSAGASPGEADFMAATERTNRTFAAQAASRGIPYPRTVRGEIKRVHLHYDFNGHVEEEWLDVMMSLADQPMLSQPGGRHRWISTADIIAMRAPQGHLQSHNADMLAMARSVRSNPEYMARVDAYWQDKLNRQTAASWAITNAIRQQSQVQMQQSQQNTQQFIQNLQAKDNHTAQFNAQMDRSSANTRDVCDHILNQQYYLNPTTGQTTTQSNQYNYTYQNGNGTIMQRNSPISGVETGNWNGLQAIPH